MYAREFIYWLQGGFEIGHVELQGEPVQVIRRHLDLVHTTVQTDQPKEILNFCGWLGGVLDVLEDVSWTARSGLTKKVQERLNGLFKHVVDSTYAGDQAELNAAHGDSLERC